MRLKSTSFFWLSLFSFAGSVVSTVIADGNANTPVVENSAKSVSGKHSCVSGPAIDDLRQLKERLDAREKELKDKESDLRALEQSVHEQMKKLDEAGASLTKQEELRTQENEQKVAKIIDTVENMSPKPAAALISTLNEELAVMAMQRLATQKLAKIMNVMEPKRSSRLTELLAGVEQPHRGLASKGGEKHDELAEQHMGSNSESESANRSDIGSKGKSSRTE